MLHARYVRLGNAAGRLEVLDAEALTEGAGTHPLFQGVRRLEVAGLAEPVVTGSSGLVAVQAPGLTLEFRGASVSRAGETVTVRVGP